MRENFVDGLRSNQHRFGLELTDGVINSLADYYELVEQHNPLLHLVAPCPAEEFATRHILESLTLLEFLPANARFADVGAGAGLPSIPCLIARDDLGGMLIESKEKKASFLREAVQTCGLDDRAQVVNRQFSELGSPDAEYVVCRALDKFAENLPRLLKWSRKRKLLLFGGPNLMAELDKSRRTYVGKLMPLSDQRYLIRVTS